MLCSCNTCIFSSDCRWSRLYLQFKEEHIKMQQNMGWMYLSLCADVYLVLKHCLRISWEYFLPFTSSWIANFCADNINDPGIFRRPLMNTFQPYLNPACTTHKFVAKAVL